MIGKIQRGRVLPTSRTTLLAVPALSAMYTAAELAGSAIMARILLCRRMGSPLLFFDLRSLRLVSAMEWLIVCQLDINRVGREAQTLFERSDLDPWTLTLLLA